MNTISFNTIVSGDSKFIRTFGIPLADELDKNAKVLNIQRVTLPTNKLFEIKTNPQNIESTTLGLFGILLTIPGWFAVKILNEIYDIKIKKIVRNIIEKADEIEIFSSKNKYKAFVSYAFIEEENILVIVAIKNKKLIDLASNIDSIPNIHASALSTLQNGSYSEIVHLYIVVDGKVNIKPYEHEDLESAHKQINKQG